MTIERDQLYGAIHSGECDPYLHMIRDWIRTRERIIAGQTLVGIEAGDEVRFSDHISPKYMVGKTATVVKVNRESIVVNCPDDPSYGRFQNARNVRCPKVLIEGAA